MVDPVSRWWGQCVFCGGHRQVSYDPAGRLGAVASQQPGSEARWQPEQRGNASRLILHPAFCLSFLCRSVVVDDRNRIAAYDLLADTRIRLKASASNFLLVSWHFLSPLVILVPWWGKQRYICLPIFTFWKVMCEIMNIRCLTRHALYIAQNAEALSGTFKDKQNFPFIDKVFSSFLVLFFSFPFSPTSKLERKNMMVALIPNVFIFFFYFSFSLNPQNPCKSSPCLLQNSGNKCIYFRY